MLPPLNHFEESSFSLLSFVVYFILRLHVHEQIKLQDSARYSDTSWEIHRQFRTNTNNSTPPTQLKIVETNSDTDSTIKADPAAPCTNDSDSTIENVPKNNKSIQKVRIQTTAIVHDVSAKADKSKDNNNNGAILSSDSSDTLSLASTTNQENEFENELVSKNGKWVRVGYGRCVFFIIIGLVCRAKPSLFIFIFREKLGQKYVSIWH